jgi:hypothetical protein
MWTSELSFDCLFWGTGDRESRIFAAKIHLTGDVIGIAGSDIEIPVKGTAT